mmetsp:Transcript_118285/g.339416  ORF Transcript_118285/g.339416 Transcript_118285/m.339416 type:complete len:89 (-) Transcript_118285:486-752(-)
MVESLLAQAGMQFCPSCLLFALSINPSIIHVYNGIHLFLVQLLLVKVVVAAFSTVSLNFLLNLFFRDNLCELSSRSSSNLFDLLKFLC